MAKSDYKAPLRGIGLLISKLLTQLAGLFLPKITDPEQRLMATGLLESSKLTVDALSDANPNDGDQLREIFNKLLKVGPFRQGAQAELIAKINQLTNENVRVLLSVVNNQSFVVADILTDADPGNTDQMEQYLRNLLRDQDGIVFLRAILGLLLKNQQYADTAAVVIIQLLLTAIDDEGAGDDTKARLVELQKVYESRALVA